MVPPVSDGHHKQKLTKNTYLSAIIALNLTQTTGFQNEKNPLAFGMVEPLINARHSRRPRFSHAEYTLQR